MKKETRDAGCVYLLQKYLKAIRGKVPLNEDDIPEYRALMQAIETVQIFGDNISLKCGKDLLAFEKHEQEYKEGLVK